MFLSSRVTRYFYTHLLRTGCVPATTLRECACPGVAGNSSWGSYRTRLGYYSYYSGRSHCQKPTAYVYTPRVPGRERESVTLRFFLSSAHTSPAHLSVFRGDFVLESVVRCAAFVRYSEFGGCSLFGSTKCTASTGIAVGTSTLVRYSEEVRYWEGPLSEVPLYYVYTEERIECVKANKRKGVGKY